MTPTARDLGRLRKRPGEASLSLAAEAVAEFLAVQDWQVAAVNAGIQLLDRGEVVAHSAVREWIESWGADEELDPPKPPRA